MTYDTPFSFHCMICFEEFHPEDRYPVVLPCGHTYVCSVCANRLDRCMECRTPLYTITKPAVKSLNESIASSSNSDLPSWYKPRNAQAHSRNVHQSAAAGDSSPRAEAVTNKKRVSLPKNVVLLSLMEATELASEQVNKASGGSPRGVSHDSERPSMVLPMNSMIDIEDDEEEKIKVSTSIAVGAAGTYAVAHKDGLQIHPTRPTESNRAMLNDFSNSSGHDEDVDTIVKSLDRKKGKSPSPTKHKSPMHSPWTPDGSNFESGVLSLSYGDRVQVVALEGGWAKLARGYGYVRVDKNQLVKVGSAVDRSCRLEAMLRDLSRRRKELRQEQTQIDNQFIHLMNDLEMSLHNDEDLTVILADTFSLPPKEIFEAEKKEDSPAMPTRVSVEAPDDIVKPKRRSQQDETAVCRPKSSFVCFAGDMFSGGCDGEAPCTSTPTGTRADLRESVSHSSLHSSSYSPTHANLFPSASHPSPSALRAGAQAWRERNGQDARTSVDFRTGLSGHSALMSTHPHIEPQGSMGGGGGASVTSAGWTGGLPKMSSHTGLSMTSKSKPFYSGILASLTLPSFSGPSDGDGRSDIARTGSM
ncbi:hypothetical protein MPSEU_000092700 [Mayamaea pseudoterrestris]|nr:hypothetical protein MPSEU_000092700 [Mayamaea pseudoterrestris]